MMSVEKFKTWLEILAISIGSIWVVYTFGYKEWWVPNHTPVNITATLSISRVSGNNSNESYIPIELSLTAHNPANRTVDLLDSIIIITGSKVNQAHIKADLWEKNMNDTLVGKTETITQLYFNPSDSKVVSVVTPFRGTDTRLDPKEQISRQHLIYIPKISFNHIEAVALLPNADHESNVSVRWSLDKLGSVVPNILKENKDGTRIFVSIDKQKEYGLQMTTVRSQLHIFN